MTQMKRGKYPVRTLPRTYYGIFDLWRFPNFHYSESVAGMKNLYYGLEAKLVRCGDYIYNVSSKPYIYDNANLPN